MTLHLNPKQCVHLRCLLSEFLCVWIGTYKNVEVCQHSMQSCCAIVVLGPCGRIGLIFRLIFWTGVFRDLTKGRICKLAYLYLLFL